MVSWDYSMNEAGGDPVGLEAYLRHAITQLPSQPKLIVKDTHMAVDRRNILRYYYNNSDALTARDPIVIHTDPAARPFLDRAEAHRPAGFQEWRKFGAPPDAPGQSLHHPAVKEHELIAWLLTMHFLSALEIIAAAESMADADSFLVRRCKVYEPSLLSRHILLPVPKSNRALNSSDQWTSIMFGEPSTGQTSRWTMNSVKCRTSFDPIIEGNLSDIVISGSAGEDLEMMLPKSKMFYNRGWVLDLSDEEKKAKRNLNRFGGLGFVDNKKAYYGISASGLIRLLLPFDAGKREGSGLPSVGDRAKNWFISVVMCEVNEKRSANACNTEKDVHYMVGGVNATSVKIMDVEGTLYLGKKLCIHIVVPDKAVLTSRAEIGLNRVPSIPTKILENQENLHQVGLLITAAIHNNHINRRDEACSISHVIWEQQKFEAATST